MGLDVYAFGLAIPVADHLSPMSKGGTPREWCTEETPGGDRAHIVAFAYTGFERSMDGLEAGRCYHVERGTHFGAGSCSGYNLWRDDLSRTMLHYPAEMIWDSLGADPDQDRFPFLELINFADNEGTIGPKAAGRLHADFVSHRSEYMRAKHPSFGGYDKLYDRFTEAFGIAAGSGLVEFH